MKEVNNKTHLAEALSQLSCNDGLVELVAAHEYVIDLSVAADHPGSQYVLKTGEESFHDFMGGPIMHHGWAMGVLLVQKHER